jgi:SSS family transporter
VSSLQVWSAAFLLVYVGVMLWLGWVGMRRVRDSDDFATARGGYGVFVMSLAFTATTASGATFLGIPALGYRHGLPALNYAILYPLGVYFGVIVCFAFLSRAGNELRSRSIPEFVGDRFQSGALRIVVATYSLMLVFYLAGQLVAGLVVFEQMLGMSPAAALGLTTVVLLVYVVLGGAHADILTDAVQGALMIALAVMVLGLFFTGAGIEGGFGGMLARLEALDARTVRFLHEEEPLYDSTWDLFAIFVSHVPLGLLPHLGNKIWALREGASRFAFLSMTTVFGVVLASIATGGIVARAILGDALLAQRGDPNQAIPALFIEILPLWLAALLGAAILAAIMSTADGLVVSTSQVFANDLYRRSLARRFQPGASAEEIDRVVLRVSRWGVALVMLVSTAVAWSLLHMNIALIVWIGIGGMMAALAGPLLLGMFWRRATAAGAMAGFAAGAIAFSFLKAGILPSSADGDSFLRGAIAWLGAQSTNPFACATIGEAVSVAATIVVSLATRPMPEAHLRRIFGR